MWSKIFTAWLLIIPFIVFNSSYEAPKVIIFLVGSFVLFVVWIFKLSTGLEKLITKSDYYYFLWIAILTISSLFGVNPAESIIGGSYRYQGVIFFLSLWIVGKTITLLDKKHKQFIYKAFFTAGGVESVILITQKIVSPNEVLGTFGNEKAAAGFIALTLFLPVVISGTNKFFIYLLSTFAIIFTKSITSVLVIISKLIKIKILIIPLFSIMIVGIVVFDKADFDNPYEGRGVIWKLAITSLRERPVLGYGAESGEVVFDEAFRVYGTRLEGLIIDRAHNIFLDVAMWSGLAGLVVFTYWIYLKIKESKDTWRVTALIGFLIFASLQPLGVSHWILLTVFLF